MQFHVFWIPVVGDPAAEDALNAFLRAHRVVSVRRELVQSEGSASWSFCVEYVEGPPATPRNGESKRVEGRQRVDYQQVLSPPDFALFLQLRDVRGGGSPLDLAWFDNEAIGRALFRDRLLEIFSRRMELADRSIVQNRNDLQQETRNIWRSTTSVFWAKC